MTQTLNEYNDGPVRILNIFGKMTAGGAEKRTIDIMRNLQDGRYIMDFCALSGEHGELEREIASHGGHTHLCKLGWGFERTFMKVLERGNYDVVHSHTHMFSGYILRLAAQFGINGRIAHFRTTASRKRFSLKRVQDRLMKYWIDKHATDIIAVGSGVMAQVWGSSWQSDGRCKIVYNGVDVSQLESDMLAQNGLRAEFGIPQDAKVVLHVGNFSPAKNHLRIISIFESLIRCWPNSYLVLVGRNNNHIGQAVRAMVTQRGLADRVILAGMRADINKFLFASDVMIFPSLWEGVPGAVLEGCAAGLPVIASDIPGNAEIAAHFANVRTVSLHEDDAAWAKHLLGSARTPANPITLFKATPFDIHRAVATMSTIWDKYRRQY